jgi:hypothetical protein
MESYPSVSLSDYCAPKGGSNEEGDDDDLPSLERILASSTRLTGGSYDEVTWHKMPTGNHRRANLSPYISFYESLPLR